MSSAEIPQEVTAARELYERMQSGVGCTAPSTTVIACACIVRLLPARMEIVRCASHRQETIT